MHWYDKAVQSLEDELAQGLITYEEFRDEIRALNQELREAAQQDAYEAYHNYY